MKEYLSGQIRNVAFIGHGGAGKTSLAEAMLFSAGAVDRLGRVDDGTTTTDYDLEETKRKISVNTSLAPCEWKNAKINVVDLPGFFDFVGEVKGGLRVVDTACVLVDAVAGPEVGTELVWKYADDLGLPRMIVVNKMDRENADFYRTLASLRQAFGNRVVPVQLPIGAQESFKGVVDLTSGQAFAGSGKGISVSVAPADLADSIEQYRGELAEAVAENDEDIMMKFLDGEELSNDEISTALRLGVAAGTVIPVFCCSATKNMGIQPLMDAMVSFLPSPVDVGDVTGVVPGKETSETRKIDDNAPFSGFVYKTLVDPFVGRISYFRVYTGILTPETPVYNVTQNQAERLAGVFFLKGKGQEPAPKVHAGDLAAVAKLQFTHTGETLATKDHQIQYAGIDFPKPTLSSAVFPKNKGEDEKIATGLHRFMDEDPTFKIYRDPETHETIASGMGELHLDVIRSRLHKKFGVEMVLHPPRIPYRETIKGKTKIEGKHKKQSGGRGQFGHCWLELEPKGPGEGFEFVDKIFGGAVPRNYIPAVEKGVLETLSSGVIAGYPVVDVRVSLVDGSYHPVDSSELAFKVAARKAFREGAKKCKPVILEPVFLVETIVPEQYMGDVMGDFNKRRGRILGMEQQGHSQVIKSMVPLAEMYTYAIDLRSMTQGRGVYSMAMDHYEEVPALIQEQIVAAAKFEAEEDE